MSPADNAINIRLRFEDYYIVVVREEENGPYDARVTDALGTPVDDATKRRALAFLLRMFSEVRKQIYQMLGGNVS